MWSPAVVTGLGIAISVALILFVLIKIHFGTIGAPMAGTVLILALVAPLPFAKIGSDIRAKISKGGAELETLAREVKQDAESASVDRKEVERLEKEIEAAAVSVNQAATNLRDLESRYRRMIGDTGSLAYLMWRSRSYLPGVVRFSEPPKATSEEMQRLATNLITEGHPDQAERAAAIARMNSFIPDPRKDGQGPVITTERAP